ncbi:MAG: carbohydrate ABC transporter permease [Lachnospiraceae bacterium]|nr:carbohydrate ABC transporter permease [Lachnospiraceae bacterium]
MIFGKKKKDDREVETYLKLTPKVLLLYLAIIVFCVVIILPLVIVFSSSLRHVSNQSSPLLLFREFTLESYITAFNNMNYPAELLNSIITTGGSVLVVVLIAPMAAYPIARIKSKLARFLYVFFISGLVIPSQMVIVPIAQTFSRLGIPNTRFTPMLMFITCSLPFSVFLFAGFMKGVPVEIEEAAYIDGATLSQRFWLVVYPLLKPAIVSTVITQGLWIWNDYFYPMVFITKKAQYSLPVGMLQFLGDKENPAQWNVLFAACVLCALPLIIVFLILQKHFVNGIAAGAVKG